MPLVRCADWPNRLHHFLLARQHDEFGYGRFDCCLFVCDAVRLMTGVDLAARFRGQYRNRRGAIEALRLAYGRPSVAVAAETIAGEHGMREVPPPLAQRGDVLLLSRPNGDHSLGLLALDGQHVVVAYRKGLWRVPVTRACRAWRV